MNNEEMNNNKYNDKKAKFLYNLYASLRASGTRDYISLNSAYLTGNSILIASISIFWRARNNINNLEITSIIVILSLSGIFLSFQMGLAQTRIRVLNIMYEIQLRDIEDKQTWLPRIYTDWEIIAQQNKLDTISDYLQDENFLKLDSLKWASKWWGARMKLLPWIFCFMYVGITVLNILPAIKIIIKFFS